MIFFNPLNACFLLLITHVHSLVVCTCHNTSSMGCCIWLGFLIFPNIISSAPSSLAFVADDDSFVLGLLCYRWMSFCSHGSSLHKVFTWFLLIVFFELCRLVFSFALHFWWTGSHPWFLFTRFFSFSMAKLENIEENKKSWKEVLAGWTPSEQNISFMLSMLQQKNLKMLSWDRHERPWVK